jgi:hypothetical protein
MTPETVMLALVASIHVFLCRKKTWMVGTRPTMTNEWCRVSGDAGGLIRVSDHRDVALAFAAPTFYLPAFPCH